MSLWSLHVPTDQHSAMQNVGRSIVWNQRKIFHACKFVSWRLTRHSHVRFIARVQEQSADRLHYHSSIEKPWLLHMGSFCSFMEPHRDERWVIWCKPSGVMFSKTWVHQPAAKTRRCVSSPATWTHLSALLYGESWTWRFVRTRCHALLCSDSSNTRSSYSLDLYTEKYIYR